MNKHLKIYLIILVAIMGLLTFMQVNKRPLVDWRKTYDVKDKTPFGLYVFNHEADTLFGGNLKRIKVSPFDYFYRDSTFQPTNILLINESLDDQSINRIITQAYKGSNVFLTARWMSYYLKDSLNFGTGLRYASNENEYVELSFTDKSRDALLKMDKLPNHDYFSTVSKLNTELLGMRKDTANNNTDVNFIKIKLGKGAFYVLADPLPLTNYYLLEGDGEQYVRQLFSYFPKNRETLWFSKENEYRSSSPLRFIHENDALRYAWQILLVGLIVYLLFSGKRKQRAVPVIDPLENKSAEFVRNIGNLYLNEGNVNDMMRKKATYFLNKVRTELLLDTTKLNPEFLEKLHLKTDVPLEAIERAVKLINWTFESVSNGNEKDLIELNKLLDEIYK